MESLVPYQPCPYVFGASTIVADNEGGALHNTGAMEINDTLFFYNEATERGLAVYNFKLLGLLSNVTFENNILRCPAGEYSDKLDPNTVIRVNFSQQR